jgi:hypothetical protein
MPFNMLTSRLFRVGFAVLATGSVLAACADLELTPEGAIRPARDAAAPDATDGGDAASATNVTTGQCMQDALTGTVLCKTLSLCPRASVDPQTFASCGYVNRNGSYTLECLCNGEFLCLMGRATTCDQAQALLQQTSYQQVCNQIGGAACNIGRTSSSSSSGSNGKPGCDRECARTCSGSKSCLELCGC